MYLPHCSDDSGCISFTGFKALYKEYPLVLFPMFRLHDKVR